MMLLRPARSCRADSLRTKPRSLIACSTRRRVGSRTICGRFKTFETVPTETPAAAATSFTPADRDGPPLLVPASTATWLLFLGRGRNPSDGAPAGGGTAAE